MTNSLPLPSPPFYPIPNINNLRDAALYPLRTPSGPLRAGILFRSADVSHLDSAGWDAMRRLGISHVFDLRSRPEVVKGWTGAIAGHGADATTTTTTTTNSASQGDKEADMHVAELRPACINAMEQAGVHRTWAPVFAATDYSPERLAGRYIKYMDESVTGFIDAYRDILRNGGPAYRKICLHLCGLDAAGTAGTAEERGGKGILVHCTAGKDRTGVFFGVLLDFLGVDRRDIAGEYQLTELGLRHVREDVVARLMQTGGFKQYLASLQAGRPLSREEMARVLERDGKVQGEKEATVVLSAEVLEMGRLAALRMVGARRESMLGALDMLDREWGSAEGYLRRECGLGDDELESLRRNLVKRE